MHRTHQYFRDPAQTQALYDKYKPTHVIHLAALGTSAVTLYPTYANPTSRRPLQEHEIQGAYSPPSSSRLASHHHHHPQLTFLRENTLINDNVLHASYKNQTQKLISCLSTCVFPDKVEYPLDESKIHLGPPHESNFGYAHAKRMVDVQNR